MKTSTLISPIGKLAFSVANGKLVKLSLASDETADAPITDGIAQTVANDIHAYFANPHHRFTAPIEARGTLFQQKVWAALRAMPAGKQVTYGALAKQLQTSARAIGQACKKNPIMIIIPCHRVVAAKDVGGYFGEVAGKKINTKAYLLAHEKNKIPLNPPFSKGVVA